MGANAEKRWRATKDGFRYLVEIDGLKLEIWKDTGNKETTFGKRLLARNFLEKTNWQKQILDVFGKETYLEIWDYVLNNQKKHEQKNPKTYSPFKKYIPIVNR